jgi:hypothetical protein
MLGVVPIATEQSGETPHRITDPYREEHFSCEGRPDGRFHNNRYESVSYNGFRIVADLNFDGRPDLILSTSDGKDSGCGNSGCPVTIYLLQSDKTYASVPFFLHPLATASERIGRGRGTLVTHAHHNAVEGALGWYEVTIASVTPVKGLNIANSKHDQELYDHWFNGKLALHAEYSRCVTGQLRWSDSYVTNGRVE